MQNLGYPSCLEAIMQTCGPMAAKDITQELFKMHDKVICHYTIIHKLLHRCSTVKGSNHAFKMMQMAEID